MESLHHPVELVTLLIKCHSSDVLALLGAYKAHPDSPEGVCDASVNSRRAEFDSHSMHALVLTLTYLRFSVQQLCSLTR